MCESIMTPANLATGRVTLLSIGGPVSDAFNPAQDLTGIRKVLEACILAGQELLLPPMADSELEEIWFIIACTETRGANALTNRLRREFDRSGLEPPISVTTLELSGNSEPWEKQIAEVTIKIEGLVQTHLLERESLR
jgi:hypothetical protein